jgi:hypothetical protein
MVMLLSMTTLKQTQFYRSRSFVTAQLYTGSALANLGSLNVTDRLISPIKLEYKQTFLQEALRNSRFNTTMKGGAWEIESSEFGSTVLAMVGPAVSQDAENIFWVVLLLLQSCYCCFGPGAGQGSHHCSQTATAVLLDKLMVFLQKFFMITLLLVVISK